MTTLNIGFGGEGGGGVYHSRYDTFEHHIRFDDPGLVYGKVMAEMVGHAVLAAADGGLPLQHPVDFARAMKADIEKVEKLAESQRTEADEQKILLAQNVFALAADPDKQHGDPVPMALVPQFDFAPLDQAEAALNKSAQDYEAALAANGAYLAHDKALRLQALMRTIDQTLLNEQGLPGRPWYKNLVYAPGRYIGYGVTTLPGVTEAITEERWNDVPKFIGLTADALKAYAARLDQATALLKG